MNRFFKWVNTSLLGHIAYYGALLTLVESLTLLYLNYVQHTLTPSLAIFVVLLCTLTDFVSAIIIWFVITLPRINRRKNTG